MSVVVLFRRRQQDLEHRLKPVQVIRRSVQKIRIDSLDVWLRSFDQTGFEDCDITVFDQDADLESVLKRGSPLCHEFEVQFGKPRVGILSSGSALSWVRY